ncbi:MAG: DUF4380 domain-containing protein [Verrucomicrobia bacterium]|nr:DUF4380 domain-containing protein [Verrucomicrobiota bacterium]
MDPEKLRISASIRNQRTDPVHWGLWSNTRFNAGVSFKAALADLQPEHIRYSDHPPFKGVVSQDKQWFTFDNSAKALAVDQATGSKAFLNTQAPLFKVMLADWILYMRPEGELNPASVHPAHATAEVFLMKHPDANQGFLELEFHSQFKTLEPGEELEFAEIWTFSPTP